MFLQVPAPNPLEYLEPGAVALLIAILLAGFGGAVFLFMTEKIVPGSALKRSQDREERATKSLESLASSFEDFIKFRDNRKEG